MRSNRGESRVSMAVRVKAAPGDYVGRTLSSVSPAKAAVVAGVAVARPEKNAGLMIAVIESEKRPDSSVRILPP